MAARLRNWQEERRDCECWFEVVEHVALRRFSVSRAGAGNPSQTVGGVLSIVHQGFFCKWSLTFTQKVGPLRFGCIFQRELFVNPFFFFLEIWFCCFAM